MGNIFNDTVAKKVYLITIVSIVIGLLIVLTHDTGNVHGEETMKMLGGLFLIGLSVLGLILFFLIRFFSK